MACIENENIAEAYKAFISKKTFPCIAARAALASGHIQCMVADSMACPKDDAAILQFLYRFVDGYRVSENSFHSAAIIFKGPQLIDEESFDSLLWQRLQALACLDKKNHCWDHRVSPDPRSSSFSFSIKEEAFFVLGLHPASSRPSRRFAYPVLAFNPHQEFEKLRAAQRYESMKEIVRKRDMLYSGSINPMLKDFGDASEASQYSGRKYDTDWQCPLQIQNGKLSNENGL
jgi:FPC/CPF motif-containing protein YcgG